MKRYTTVFRAIDSTDGNLKSYVGPEVFSSSHEEAQAFCNRTMPYCKVIGEFVSEVDEFTGKELDIRRN